MREICTSGSTRGRWATDLFCYPPSYSTGPMFFGLGYCHRNQTGAQCDAVFDQCHHPIRNIEITGRPPPQVMCRVCRAHGGCGPYQRAGQHAAPPGLEHCRARRAAGHRLRQQRRAVRPIRKEWRPVGYQFSQRHSDRGPPDPRSCKSRKWGTFQVHSGSSGRPRNHRGGHHRSHSGHCAQCQGG